MTQIVQEGGPVTWVILAGGVLALSVFLERILHLHRARIKSEDFLRGIRNNLQRGNVGEAVTICDETPGPVAHVVKTAIMNRAGGRDAVRAAVDNAGRAEIARMERRLAVISTVAQTAPLAGLFGTVLGLMESVLAMKQQAPLIQSFDVADGLLKALTATAAGLAVAIPAQVAFNVLVGRVEKIVLDMERAASDIIEFLNRTPPPAMAPEESRAP